MNLEDIQKLSLYETKSLLERMIKLQEEVGELAEQVLIAAKSSGSSSKKGMKKGIQYEAVDVILVALSLFFLEGGTPSGLEKAIQVKMAKWKKSMR